MDLFTLQWCVPWLSSRLSFYCIYCNSSFIKQFFNRTTITNVHSHTFFCLLFCYNSLVSHLTPHLSGISLLAWPLKSFHSFFHKIIDSLFEIYLLKISSPHCEAANFSANTQSFSLKPKPPKVQGEQNSNLTKFTLVSCNIGILLIPKPHRQITTSYLSKTGT